jgi:hypothetical protein
MDILISVIIAGFAVGYVVEVLTSLITRISPKWIKLTTTLPLSLVALLTLGLNGPIIFVLVPASAFVSLVTMLLVSKPVEVTQVVNRR